MKKTIEISETLYQFLETNSKFGETPNDVINRLLNYNTALTTTLAKAAKRTIKLHFRNIGLWEGMKMRAVYKGREYTATIQNGAIVHNGQNFSSPSAVAMYICKNPVNGWVFWDYYNDATNKWEQLSSLRKS